MDINDEFSYIWEKVILPVRKVTENECDPNFSQAVNLHFRDGNDWKQQIETEFHRQRNAFKRQCYNSRKNQNNSLLLDNRKVAAVLCQTYLQCKAFTFNLEEARKQAKFHKACLQDEAYTRWAVNNTLINYKFASLVGTQMIYITLLADLLSKNETSEMGIQLLKRGCLFSYPADPECDSFDVNIAMGLARSDIAGYDLNILLYAMLLYQMEMYTRNCLTDSIKQASYADEDA